MKFEIIDTYGVHIHDDYVLKYIVDDYSFSYEPKSYYQDFSLAVNTLELSIDDNFFLSSVSGYDPYLCWNHIHTFPPPFRRGGVRAIIDFDYVPGGAYYVGTQKVWPEYVNVEAGWICVGDCGSAATAIEFANGCVVVLENNEIVSLWLRPVSLPRALQG